MSDTKPNECYVCGAIPCVETEEETNIDTGETILVMRYDDVVMQTLDGSGHRVICCDCMTALRDIIRAERGL
jgi:hypothetical protein